MKDDIKQNKIELDDELSMLLKKKEKMRKFNLKILKDIFLDKDINLDDIEDLIGNNDISIKMI